VRRAGFRPGQLSPEASPEAVQVLVSLVQKLETLLKVADPAAAAAVGKDLGVLMKGIAQVSTTSIADRAGR
jgi:hypothetical protein